MKKELFEKDEISPLLDTAGPSSSSDEFSTKVQLNKDESMAERLRAPPNRAVLPLSLIHI